MVIKASNSRTKKKMKPVSAKVLTCKGPRLPSREEKDAILGLVTPDSPNWPGLHEPASFVLLLLSALPLRLTNASDYLQHVYP